MMADQKGRSGKKPKYQIADIGGTDLTSEDISTERVLNFLIKGELGSPADQTTDAESDGLDAGNDSPEQAPTDSSAEATGTSLPSPEAQGKKSLAHLFRRARGGDGGTVKNLKLELGPKEPAAAVPSELQATKPEAPLSVSPDSSAESGIAGLEQPPQTLAANETPSVASELPSPATQPDAPPQPIEPRTVAAKTPGTSPSRESEELAHLTALWKSFYRLNSGEIDALSALYQMSHAEGSSECYIKMHKLAEMSNLTYRYCQKVVRSLEQLGWITKLKDYDASTQLGVLYRINLKPTL